MPGRSAPILLTAFFLLSAMAPAAAQEGERLESGVVAPRADEPGPGPSSWDASPDVTPVDEAPVDEAAAIPSSRGELLDAGRSSSIEGPSVFPDMDEEVAPNNQPAGVNAACTALTDAVERDRCRSGSVAGQPDLPPTPD